MIKLSNRHGNINRERRVVVFKTLEKVYKVLLAPYLSYKRSQKFKHGCNRKSTNEHSAKRHTQAWFQLGRSAQFKGIL